MFLFLICLLIPLPLLSCSCLKREKNKPNPEAQYSPTKVESGEQVLAKFQAATVLQDYKSSHETEVAKLKAAGLDEQGVDRAIMRMHLRTGSRHITPQVREAFTEATK